MLKPTMVYTFWNIFCDFLFVVSVVFVDLIQEINLKS